MGIEFDSVTPGLQPLKERARALLDSENLLAVGTVELAAGETAVAALREFYQDVLGLEFVGADAEGVTFRLELRTLRLKRGARVGLLESGGGSDAARTGRVALAIRNFRSAMKALDDRRVPYELVHMDGGLSRLAILHDPAGNWVHLFETRPF